MRRSNAGLFTLAGLVVLASCLLARVAVAEDTRAPSSEERKRRELLRRLGLDKADTAPSPGAPAATETAPEPAAPTSAPAPTPTPTPTTAKALPERVGFEGAVHAGLVRTCKVCHVATGPAGKSRLILDGDVGRDYAGARALVNVGQPEQSLLVTKAAGVLHGGGALYAKGSTPQRLLLRWIAGGATRQGRAAQDEPAGVATVAPAPAPARQKRVKAPAAPLPPPPVVAPAGAATGVADVTGVAPVPGNEAVTKPDAAVAPVAAGPPPVGYDPEVHALLTARCVLCHNAGGMAAATRYLLSGDVEADYRAARALIDLQRPADSALIAKAEGRLHAGGALLPAGSTGQALLLAWVKAGAVLRPAAPVPPAVATATEGTAAAAAPAKAPMPGLDATPAPAPAPLPRPALAHGGVELPFALRLNGRFDLNYERRKFSDNPFADGSVNALANYHHFVFLTRDAGVSDPFGFTAEITSLEFWEAHVRLGPRQPGALWRVWLKAGKLLVPFGAEPLFHQRYGGHTGFDQRVVPIIWAQPGARAQLLLSFKPLSVTFDLYAVNGYALRAADAVLNLQNDFSPADEARIAVGQRIGVAAGPVAAWYSAYYNPLGFGRHLFLQAMDVGISRWRGVPVVNRFALSAGLLRADVGGGGAGNDYYHFASYAQLRFYPWDFLYLQYRQGLRTFNNRRGVIQDGTRFTADDGSTHNFEVVARYHGLTGGVGYFFNLEKADEVPNDLFRVMVAFEF